MGNILFEILEYCWLQLLVQINFRHLASHAVFSPPAHERLSVKNLFEQVIVTNSIPVSQKEYFPQLKVLSVANMLGEAIWRIHEESSVSSMFR